jgi:hypothetical protein
MNKSGEINIASSVDISLCFHKESRVRIFKNSVVENNEPLVIEMLAVLRNSVVEVKH